MELGSLNEEECTAAVIGANIGSC